mgnify:FL=1
MKIKIPSEIWVELYSEIAGAMVHSRPCNRIWVQDENGDLKYTDEAQEKFNKCAEVAEGMLEDFFIKGE